MVTCLLVNAAYALGNTIILHIHINKCNTLRLCYRQFIRRKAVTSVGQRELPVDCPAIKGGKISCRGKLHDTILDWEHELPVRDLGLADIHSK